VALHMRDAVYTDLGQGARPCLGKEVLNTENAGQFQPGNVHSMEATVATISYDTQG
jgi:hypothetical protein